MEIFFKEPCNLIMWPHGPPKINGGGFGRRHPLFPWIDLIMLHQRLFGSCRNRHHHIDNKAKLLARRLAIPSPPLLEENKACFQEIQENFFSPNLPHQKKFRLIASKDLITLEGALKIDK